MPDIRVPVSLKFDQDSDVFNDLVVELRDTRDLSPFLVELLDMYYADTEVRDLINLKREQNNPFSAVREHLTKINLQHSKTVMATSMLQNQTQGIIDSVVQSGMASGMEFERVGTDESAYTMDFGTTKSGGQPTQSQIGAGQNVQITPEIFTSLINRMGTLEALVPEVLEKLNLLTTQQPVAAQPVNQQAPTIQQAPIIQQAPSQETVAPFIAPIAPYVAQGQSNAYDVHGTSTGIESAPQVMMQAETSAPIIIIGGEAPMNGAPQMVAIPGGAPVVEEQPKKPASFAKAFGSIKKKQ